MTVAAAERSRVRNIPPAPRWALLVAVVVVWVGGWLLLRGQATLYLPRSELTPFHTWINEVRDAFDAARDTNPILKYFFGGIREVLDAVVVFWQQLISQPAFPRPVPEIGWFGVVAIAGWVTYALAGWRMAVFSVLAFLSFGFLGYWEDSLDTLIITFTAVAIAVAFGISIGIWMARSRTVTMIVTPVLDVMQTMPTFVYLLPLTLLFSIGPAAATVATLIYALPPVTRITAHGIRTVRQTVLEASTSLGASKRQQLRKVQLPMAKRTIIVGVNQTMMAALSMATIAALINGPGLGGPVIEALQTLDVGDAFVSGLAIVIMAILLDRVTTAASERSEAEMRGRASDPRRRRILLAATGVLTLVAIYLSRLRLELAEFPDRPDIGTPMAEAVQSATDWVVSNLDGLTSAITNLVSYGLLNPLQSLLANSPWWLVAGVLLAVSAVLGGRWSALTTLVCIVLLLGTGLWNDAMVTLTMTLVATVLVMGLAMVFGVWMARDRRADRAIRPLLDAGQTIPPFVYLVPALGLFGTTRFTAIIAAIVYAAPPAIKLVADGIRGVSPTAVEAAISAGSSRWQVITKVQVPMARSSIVLAANQGLLFVLAMVVIGGLVGGGALGYLVVAGFSQAQLFGKGVAAGIAIVLLGIMLDRITQRAAARTAAPAARAAAPTTRRPAPAAAGAHT